MQCLYRLNYAHRNIHIILLTRIDIFIYIHMISHYFYYRKNYILYYFLKKIHIASNENYVVTKKKNIM